MLPAPIPRNEPERIASLRKMLLLSSPDEEAFDRVTRMAQRVFNVPIALISLIDANRQWFKSCIGLPVRETGRDVSFCGHAILQDDVFVIENALEDPRFEDNPLVTGEPHVLFYAGRPLRNAENYMIGTLCIIDHSPRTFSNEDRRALNDLGYWIEQVFYGRELSESQKKVLQELDEVRLKSMLDPMLNIWHHGAAIDMLEREVIRSYRNKIALSILIMDIDSFKTINDLYGHIIGDQVLIECSKVINSCIRPYDVNGRYGDDKFIVILPDANFEKAQQIAERLCRSIQIQPFLAGETLFDVTISIGISSTDFHDETPNADELLGRANKALLAAKHLGRNRAEAFTGTGSL